MTQRTRIAPTPSGFLHLGNLVHFQLVQWWAEAHGAEIHLRIDDVDAVRVRADYVSDIFRCLDFLGITPESGPSTFAEYQPRDPRFREDVRADLARAQERGLQTYVCTCSRRTSRTGERCACRGAMHSWHGGESSVRWEDVVLWRRDDLPSTLLTSLILDRNEGITHVLRGADLAPTTQLQRRIASYFDAEAFTSAQFAHHGLVLAPDGTKLSKSAGAQARPLDLPAVREQIHREAGRLWSQLETTL